MKVMVQENVAFTNKVVNGAVGTVRNIRYEEEDGCRFPIVVYVEIPGAGRVCPTVDDDVVPIFPVQYSFRWTRVPKTATRPAQKGRSLAKAVVDPATAQSLQGLYVMLSRVRNLDGLAILRPFPRQKIYQRLPQELREELGRLERLDHETTLRYNGDPDHFHSSSY
ncbi:hypothetical protein C8Q76DRAFT_793606 [Earliella scabrosa]|nr:hypothetical protein C8Q76DRAFT_793606 [Earliella scabrosa]